MTIDEQQQRHAASMELLKKMGAFVDEMTEERDERRELEKDYQARCVKAEANDGE